MSEIDELLGDDKNKVEKPVEPPLDAPKDPEILTKEQQLANVQTAIAEANTELKRIREEKKKVVTEGDKPDDKPLKIDLEDPNSKAWDKHINEKVAPVNAELDAEKQEIFKYSLQEFLKDKPALAKNPERMKSFVQTYERIRSSTGKTREGVMLDLQKAFGAEYSEELIQRARENRAGKAMKDALFSDAGVSSSSGAYIQPTDDAPVYSDEERKILARWGMTPDDHAKLKKELLEKEKKEV